MTKLFVIGMALLCIVLPGLSAAYTLEDSKSVDEARKKMGLPDVSSTAADSLQDNGNRTVSDSETIGEEAASAEKDAEAYYNTHKDEFKEGGQVKISHIMVKTNKEANDILKMLQKESFEKLAKKYSIGPTASKGGELGYIEKGTVVQEFEDAATLGTLIRGEHLPQAHIVWLVVACGNRSGVDGRCQVISTTPTHKTF